MFKFTLIKNGDAVEDNAGDVIWKETMRNCIKVHCRIGTAKAYDDLDEYYRLAFLCFCKGDEDLAKESFDKLLNEVMNEKTLSATQKEVIKKMREGYVIVRSVTTYLKPRGEHNRFSYHRVHDSTFFLLLSKNMISRIQKEHPLKYYELTDLGKEVEL